MVDEEDKKKEDSFEFDSAGEAVGYVSMATARVLAMRAAREEPGNYGAAFEGIQMIFKVVSSEQDPEDEGSRYHLSLSYRPEGNFEGQPGIEEFILTDVGEMEIRQVFSWPIEESVTPDVDSTPQPVGSQSRKEETAQREQEAAAQREREEIARLELEAAQREREEAAQREREEAARRERETVAQRERKAARLEREKVVFPDKNLEDVGNTPQPVGLQSEPIEHEKDDYEGAVPGRRGRSLNVIWFLVMVVGAVAVVGGIALGGGVLGGGDSGKSPIVAAFFFGLGSVFLFCMGFFTLNNFWAWMFFLVASVISFAISLTALGNWLFWLFQ